MSRNLPLTPAEFKEIYSKVTRLCVDLVIYHQDKFILTLRQKDGWVGLWHLPGGTVYFKESITDAIQRIAKEELGLDVTIDEYLSYLEYPSETKERGYGYSISLVFKCHTSNTNIKLDSTASASQFFESAPENTVFEQKSFLDQIK